MKISNIFLGGCLVFIAIIFFISPRMIEKKIPATLPSGDVFTPQDAGFIGKIIKEPIIKSDNLQLIIKSEIGKILITTANYPQYEYGDVLKANGKLQFPTVFEDFNYKNYLAKDEIYYVMYYPKIEVLEKDKGNPIFSAILKFKNNLTLKAEKIMPFPEVSILEGLILGNKQIFSERIKNNLSITGTSHIVAISGMNIVIISEILIFVLIALGMWRKQAFWLVLVLVFLFILMVGAPASAVRAGIMGAILLYAQKIGRLGSASRIIVFAGTIMLIFNPLLLRYDIGFQLSFLAVLGLIYIKPILDGFLEKIKKQEQISNFLQIITTTLAAQIAVLPILIYNFGKISFISPIANIFIVPVIPFITIVSLIFLGGMAIWGLLGKILLWPAYLSSAYVLRLVDWFAGITWAAKGIPKMSWIWLVVYYLLIIGIILWFYKRRIKLQY